MKFCDNVREYIVVNLAAHHVYVNLFILAIAHIPVTKIRVCTGAELKRMCPELPCECPPTRAGWSLISGLRSLVGFGLKAALAAALVYWSYDIGLWGDSTRTEEIYSEICQAIMPMFCSKSARDTLQPRELSELCEAEMDMMCVVSVKIICT